MDPLTTSPAHQIIIFDNSNSHLTNQHAGWWDSFKQRSLAFYNQSLGLPTAPKHNPIDFYTVYSPNSTTNDDLALDFQHLSYLRRENDCCPRRNHGSFARCFGVVREWSDEKDAIELFLPSRQNPPGSSDGEKQVLLGPRFAITWALYPESEEVGTDVVVNDEFGVARRLQNELRVDAHFCSECRFTKSACLACTCEWHSEASSFISPIPFPFDPRGD